MKSIIINLQPNDVERILNNKKTVEIKKTRPKCELPFKALIYCTKEKYFEHIGRYKYSEQTLWVKRTGEIGLGETFHMIGTKDTYNGLRLNGKVVGEFICDKIEKYEEQIIECGSYYTRDDSIDYELNERSCMDNWEISDYGNHKPIYLWYISDLRIYDKPKELSEFGVKKAFSSWRYVQGE